MGFFLQVIGKQVGLAVMGRSFGVDGGWQAEAGLSSVLDPGCHPPVPVPGALLHDLCCELGVLWPSGQSGAGISDPLRGREYSYDCRDGLSWASPLVFQGEDTA